MVNTEKKRLKAWPNSAFFSVLIIIICVNLYCAFWKQNDVLRQEEAEENVKNSLDKEIVINYFFADNKIIIFEPSIKKSSLGD